MLTISIPNNFLPERRYIISVLISEFLGLDCRIAEKDGQDYVIRLENNGKLIVRDHFFSRLEEGTSYLSRELIPRKAVFTMNTFSPDADLPVIYGSDEFSVSGNLIVCGIDIFASSFFMLTRWEECADTTRDDHDRFPAAASLAGRSGFLDRAVVNEYVEMLWNMLRHLGYRGERKQREFRTLVSHDVDAPFLHALKSFPVAMRQAGGDLVKRLDPALAAGNLAAWVLALRDERRDPLYTFDTIMELSEKKNLTSTFFFIADHSDPEHDGDYDLRHPLLRRLMRNIRSRGHEIGVHFSYGTFRSASQTEKEYGMLRKACADEGISQNTWGSRQHYLRWETPDTFGNLDQAGIDYDSTLSYADAAGFRCGTCYEYPVFHVRDRRRLNLKERPLLVMECTVIDERYMKLGTGEEAFSFMKGIKDMCRRFSGDFTLLWHNTRFCDYREKNLYEQMLAA